MPASGGRTATKPRDAPAIATRDSMAAPIRAAGSHALPLVYCPEGGFAGHRWDNGLSNQPGADRTGPADGAGFILL
jgi:hypothetical protein